MRVEDGHFLEIVGLRDAVVDAGEVGEGHVALEAAEEGDAAGGRGGGEGVLAGVEEELHFGRVVVEPVCLAQDTVGEGGVFDKEGLLVAGE